MGFDLAKINVQENAGSVNICVSSSIDNFQKGRVTLQVVIPMCHENGKPWLAHYQVDKLPCVFRSVFVRLLCAF